MCVCLSKYQRIDEKWGRRATKMQQWQEDKTKTTTIIIIRWEMDSIRVRKNNNNIFFLLVKSKLIYVRKTNSGYIRTFISSIFFLICTVFTFTRMQRTDAHYSHDIRYVCTHLWDDGQRAVHTILKCARISVSASTSSIGVVQTLTFIMKTNQTNFIFYSFQIDRRVLATYDPSTITVPFVRTF